MTRPLPHLDKKAESDERGITVTFYDRKGSRTEAAADARFLARHTAKGRRKIRFVSAGGTQQTTPTLAIYRYEWAD